MEKVKSIACILFLLTAGCAQTEFTDDFEDGILHPAYRFSIGSASLVSEEEGVLSAEGDVELGLDAIPGKPYPVAPTTIRCPAELGLAVIDASPNEILLLSLVGSAGVPEDFFSVGFFASVPVCADEEEMVSLEGISMPATLSIACGEDATVTGSLEDGSGTHPCPLVSTLEDVPLSARIHMTGKLVAGYGTVDDFLVRREP